MIIVVKGLQQPKSPSPNICKYFIEHYLSFFFIISMFFSVTIVYDVLMYLFLFPFFGYPNNSPKNLFSGLVVGIHKWFIYYYLRINMDPAEFIFLILPLAALVTILVVIVLYLARKEDVIRHKDVETLNELMQTGVVNKDNFYMFLQDLVSNKMIKEDSYETLGKLLQESFNETEETTQNLDDMK